MILARQSRELKQAPRKARRKKRQQTASESKPKKKRSVLSTFLPLIGVLVGLAIVGYPVVMDAYSTWKANQVISSLESEVDVSDDPSRLMYLEQARAYNDRMANLPYTEPEGGIINYDDQLSWKGKPYMAYLQIPKSHIKTPVYHGTADAELAAGVGHLEGRSLPVGGQKSTCVLEGHSGMTTSRMFDDIRMLDEGDMFCVWTLEEPYAYKVVKWEILNPDKVIDKLELEDGVDRVVLITCTTTPDALNEKGRIGVNDKRLLVYGERCEFDADYFAEDDSFVTSVVTSPRSWPFLILFGIVLLLGILWFVLSRRRRKRKRDEAAKAKEDATSGTDELFVSP